MIFQRTIVGLLVLAIASLAASFYIYWKMSAQLRTVKAFVEGYVFAEAVAACEKVESTTPFKWNTGTHTAVSSPARNSFARFTASRRLVFTRSPGFFGISDGAATRHA